MSRNVFHFPGAVLAFALAAAFPVLLGAQQAPELNEIVVTATRIESPILDSPSAISIIPAGQISGPGAIDLPSVLAQQTGLTLNDYGPVGESKTVSLRGSTSDQVLVLLDGVRLNSGRISAVDLSSIPMDIIDHVEILRGTASTIYGSGAIGGVINIITKKPDTPDITLSLVNGAFLPHAATEVSATYLATPPYVVYSESDKSANWASLLDTQQVQMSVAGAAGDARLLASGSFTKATNGFTWLDSSMLDGWRVRTNADSLAGSTSLGVDAPLLGGSLAVKTMVDASETGTPGSLTVPSSAGRQYDTSVAGTLGWKTDRFLRDDLTMDVKTSYKYDDLRLNDPAAPPESVHRTQTAGLDVTQRWGASETVSFVYGGSAYYDEVDSTNYADVKRRLNLGGFVSAPVAVTSAVTVTPSVRYDYFTDFAGSLSYSLSGVWAVSDISSLRASVGSAYRAPALNDLYWYDPLGTSDPYYTTGNPDLKPETAYSGEIGWSLLSRAVTIDASVFTRLVFDNIVWLYDAGVGAFGGYLPENLTRTLYPGAELHARVPIIGGFSIDGTYTLLYSYVLNDGTSNLSLSDNIRVPYVPVHNASLSLRWDGSLVSASIEGQYVSKKFTDNANTASASMPAYFVANAAVAYKTSDRMTITLAAKNLLNSLYYTQLGYPMPPFSLEAGVKLHL